MLKRIAASTLASLALFGTEVQAAGTAGPVSDPDPATIDAIVRKMESSGALDSAVDRAIDRYVRRKDQARQAEEAKQQADLAGRSKSARPVDAKRDHIRGKASAAVSLIEYTDYECPFCKRFHATPSAMLEKYGGRVNWVVRNYPLDFHDPAAHNEALAAECVAKLGGNDAYWKYADALFANTRSNGAGLPADKSIARLAQADGIKSASLTQCMADAAIAKRVQQDIDDATTAGVTGTPTTVIRNNRTGASEALVGAQPAENLEPIIERMLNDKS